MAHLIVFGAGFALEWLAVRWVHYAERGARWRAALCAALYGVAQVTGIGGAIRVWHVAACLCLGYGAGTFFAIRRAA